VARRPHPKPTHTYDTQANIRKKMELLEQENHVLREEKTTMRAKMEKFEVDKIVTRKGGLNCDPLKMKPIT